MSVMRKDVQRYYTKDVQRYYTTGSSFEDRDSVTQWPAALHAQEDQSLTIHCSFTHSASSNIYLQWYRQDPGERVKYILQRYKLSGGAEDGDKAPGVEDRFSALLDAPNKYTNLNISGIQMRDSAVFHCALRPTVKETSLHTLYWFDLELFDTSSMFSATLDKESSSVPLTISAALVTDSAVYYCARRPAGVSLNKVQLRFINEFFHSHPWYSIISCLPAAIQDILPVSRATLLFTYQERGAASALPS
ncbi:uncharacterized protein LOC121300181 [Polyodon spathula]|uniref:uncharacterized protein LOC121300181 n=1 Tax=Polyodon spathula TaxID=7913 RepID=UPI001B7D9881|nr:uncharacterized protein LOC121300181 [Polyodon spathula]